MKTKNIVYALIILLLTSGCSDFLNENNKGGITSDDFYKTEEGYITLITATYNSLRSVYGTKPWLFVAGTDMIQESHRYDHRGIQAYQELTAEDPDVTEFYTRCYQGIQKANAALHYAATTEVEPNKLSVLVGEMRFIRAFYHFLLLEQFGGVCINQEMTLTPRVDMPRASLEETFTFVISELEGIVGSVQENANPKGRVDRNVVLHFLAKAYLTRGWDLGNPDDFTTAARYAEEVLAGKSLHLTFDQVWSPHNENNEEILWAVQYDVSSMPNVRNDGNVQFSLFGPYLEGQEDNLKYSSTDLYPTWYLHSWYGEDDARYDGTFMRTIYLKGYHFVYTKTPEELAQTNIQHYYPRKWDGEWTDEDTEVWRNEDLEHRVETKVHAHPADPSGWDVLQGAFCPIIRKFDDPKQLDWIGTCSSRDVVVARLAETYFLAAEAYLKSNQPQKATEKINAVLSRPGNSKSGKGLPLLNESDITLDRLLEETAKELAGEYLRWPELRRTKMLKERCMKYNPDVMLIGPDAFKGIDGRDKIYRPIPQKAFDLNRAEIEQNPGY